MKHILGHWYFSCQRAKGPLENNIALYSSLFPLGEMGLWHSCPSGLGWHSLSVHLLGEGGKYSGWTVTDGRWLFSHQAVTPDLLFLPPAAGSMPEFLPSPRETRVGGKEQSALQDFGAMSN